MNPIIINHKQEIIQLCRKHKVKQLWVFGSVVTDQFKPTSDVDFLYEMDEENISEEEWYDAFWGFHEALRVLLGRAIDLVWYYGIKNPYFKEEVDETKQLIYDQESEKIPV